MDVVVQSVGRHAERWCDMKGKKMKGGGLARKGVGMALASGGIVKAPARSYKDMRAGAGSGVGRIQKTKIQRGR